VFFGAGTLLTLWRAVTTNGPVVTLSPAGICDQRLAPQEIPWPAIRSISPWIQQRQRFMVLKVDPEVEAKLELTPIARMTFEANRALGAGGLCVGSQGLKIDHEELLAIAEAYHRAHGEL
jgi:hypothetical protein